MENIMLEKSPRYKKRNNNQPNKEITIHCNEMKFNNLSQSSHVKSSDTKKCQCTYETVAHSLCTFTLEYGFSA